MARRFRSVQEQQERARWRAVSPAQFPGRPGSHIRRRSRGSLLYRRPCRSTPPTAPSKLLPTLTFNRRFGTGRRPPFAVNSITVPASVPADGTGARGVGAGGDGAGVPDGVGTSRSSGSLQPAKLTASDATTAIRQAARVMGDMVPAVEINAGTGATGRDTAGVSGWCGSERALGDYRAFRFDPFGLTVERAGDAGARCTPARIPAVTERPVQEPAGTGSCRRQCRRD